MRRLLLPLLLVLALAPVVSGCGAASKAIGGIAAHRIANHFVHSAAGQRRVNKAFCLYQLDRAIHDLRTHHAAATAINAYAAYHSCKGGFGHSGCSVQPGSAEELTEGLRSVGYLPQDSTALVAYLATRLGKPVLVEGPAGVGKTELAKSLASYLGRELIRLQCYEGLDEAKALYEWNYRKQLLRIQAEADGTGWSAIQDDIFGDEFLLARPLMRAITSQEPVVLLIDEIDKTDQEFEAMLLEVLSDFQITIPELGRIEARTHPVVLLTSNNSRELTEALKRRCLYLWLDYPALEHELEIVRLHAPELPDTVARKLVELVSAVRDLDLKKPPSIAESIDWARALLLLGAQDIDQATFNDTMSVIVKHRADLDTVAERVGVKLLAGSGDSATAA